MFWERCKEAGSLARSAWRADVIEAPEDCRSSAGLRWLLEEGRRQLRAGTRVLRIDLSQVERMNIALLATVLLLVREAARSGRRLRVVDASEEFRNWARTFSLLETLEARGVMEGAHRRAPLAPVAV